MKVNILKILFVCGLILVPGLTSAETIKIENIDVKIQPQKNNEFQLFIKFDLPDLPENAHIDYAVLDMGINILANQDSATMIFEILSEDNASSDKIVNYNNNPVTTLVSRREKGYTQMELEITQLVELWVKDGEQNNGIVLVSHRNIADKFLSPDRITLAPNFKSPIVKIFYTVIE